MKNFITKVGSVLMAVLVLVSTMSFTIDMRYCDGDLLETTIFSNAEDTCSNELSKVVTDTCCKPVKNCCSEDQIIIEGLDDLSSNSVDALQSNSQILLAIWVRPYLQTFIGAIRNIKPYEDYTPPKLIPDIQKLHEVYLL